MYNRKLDIEQAKVIAGYLDSLKSNITSAYGKEVNVNFSMLNNRKYVPAKAKASVDEDYDEGYFQRRFNYGAHFCVQYTYLETRNFSKYTPRAYYYKTNAYTSGFMPDEIHNSTPSSIYAPCKDAVEAFTNETQSYSCSGIHYLEIRRDLVEYWGEDGGHPEASAFVLAIDGPAVWRVSMADLLERYRNHQCVQMENTEKRVICYFGLRDQPDYVASNPAETDLARKISESWVYLAHFTYSNYRARSSGYDVAILLDTGTFAQEPHHYISLAQARNNILERTNIKTKLDTIKKSITRKGFYAYRKELDDDHVYVVITKAGEMIHAADIVKQLESGKKPSIKAAVREPEKPVETPAPVVPAEPEKPARRTIDRRAYVEAARVASESREPERTEPEAVQTVSAEPAKAEAPKPQRIIIREADGKDVSYRRQDSFVNGVRTRTIVRPESFYATLDVPASNDTASTNCVA